MRTRNYNWLNTKTLNQEYGIQVFANGKWCHLAENGKPCIFKTEAERDLKRAQVRKMKTATEA